jgi:hypothetical protein
MGIVKAAAKTEFHRSVRRTVRKLCAQQHATTTAQLSNALAQKDVLLREKGVVKTPGHMNKFKIKVARIETTGRDEQNEQVCVTFQLDRRLTSFQVPVLLGINDFDDTEMVQAARNAIHLIFAELASQSLEWKLTANDVKQLSSISMRPKS